MRTPLLTGLTVLGLAGAALPGDAAGGAWVPVLPTDGPTVTLSAFPNGVAYARTEEVGYLRSTDFGSTWTRMPSPGGEPGQVAVRFGTPTAGYAIAGGVTRNPALPGRCTFKGPLMRTTDGGQTWIPLCLPDTPAPADTWFFPSGWFGPSVARDGRMIALMGWDHRRPSGERCGRSVGTVYTSHDSGDHWTRWTAASGDDWYPFEIEWFDSRTAAMIAYDVKWSEDNCSGESSRNAVWITRDGGKTFRKVFDCKRPALCTAAAFVTRDRLLAGHSDGSTWMSKDGGRTWRAGQRLVNAVHVPPDDVFALIAGPRTYWVQDFAFTDSRNGYASTRGGGTWRTFTGGDWWKQERSHECVSWTTGVGEIAAANKDRALTGGPGFVSVRVPLDVDPEGCERPPQSVPDEPLVIHSLDGTVLTVLPDARVTVGR